MTRASRPTERCAPGQHHWVQWAPHLMGRTRDVTTGEWVIPYFCDRCATRLRDDGTPANEPAPDQT